jgi:hypothetical protein
MSTGCAGPAARLVSILSTVFAIAGRTRTQLRMAAVTDDGDPRRDAVRADVERRYRGAGFDSDEMKFDSNGYPEDDPENGIFWGPPDDRAGIHFRWSHAWFDWRGGEA